MFEEHLNIIVALVRAAQLAELFEHGGRIVLIGERREHPSDERSHLSFNALGLAPISR